VRRLTRRWGRKSRRVLLLCSACLGVLSCGDAWALLQSCGVSAVAVNFGAYNPLSGSPTVATGTVTVSCTATVLGLLESWTVALNSGNSVGFSPRQLANGPSTLNYNLYTSAAYSSIWGDGSGTTSVISDSQFVAVGTTTTHYTVYGRIPAGQDAAAGTYVDTIMVTLNY
jgi:spore coat protein U-like protein